MQLTPFFCILHDLSVLLQCNMHGLNRVIFQISAIIAYKNDFVMSFLVWHGICNIRETSVGNSVTRTNPYLS